MITIISDPYHYQEPAQCDVCARSVDDYVPVRRAIRAALNSRRRLSVYVTHQTVLAWLQDLRGYGRDIVWQDVDPTKTFTDVFGFAPPPLFEPHTILALELEALPRPQNGVQVDPVAWILGARLGAVWSESQASDQHLGRLITALAADPAPLPAVLGPLIAQQLAAWSQQYPNYAGLRTATIQADATRYLVRWATQRYDQTGWNDVTLLATPILQVAPDPLICRAVLAEYDGDIHTYWNRWFAHHQPATATITQALNQMMGLSAAELRTISRVLETRPALLDAALLTALRQTFADLPEAASSIAEWATHVAPPLPAAPQAAWSTERWLHWATDEYLPYFAWIVRTNQPRDQQQQFAAQWSDWLYAQYPRWLNQPDAPLVLGQYAHMRDILDRDQRAVVVWLVVDGLTWWQGEILHRACVDAGLHVRAHRAGVAVLPSITSVAKRALVTGVPNPIHEPTRSIAQAANAQLDHSGISHLVTYRSDEASQHLSHDQTTRCYVVFYNRLDELAHSMTTFTDDAGIRGSLSDLAALAARMSRTAAAQGRTLHLLVGSDHGSTRLPANAVALSLPQNSREWTDWDAVPEQAATARSTRAAIITDPDRLTAREREQWYVLDRHQFQLDQHYLVPRGAQYIGRKPSGWTHGGLEPEEVVVPLLHFTPQPFRHEPLVVRFTGELEAFRESLLIATISNPNPLPLEWVTLQLDSGFAVIIEHISAHTTHEQTVHLPATTTQANEYRLVWTLSYAIIGVNYTETGQQTVLIRRLQTQDDAFDDFFA